MSAAEVFLDTNVFLYLFSPDIAKAQRAESVIEGGGTVSVQVLNEFAAVARRKVRLEFPEIREALRAVRSGCRVVSLDIETHELGLDIAERYRLSVYDGMIVAAAIQAGCRILYSEDLQHGQQINGVTIQSPFRDSP
jgi:predicted nucleic acid-binding protein